MITTISSPALATKSGGSIWPWILGAAALGTAYYFFVYKPAQEVKEQK